MFKLLKRHLKDKTGSEYIEMLICMMSLLVVAVILFSACTTLVQKLWLDEKMSDIAKLVNSSGTTKSEAITELENAIKNKFGGGEITYETNYLNDDANEAKVQLGNVVVIKYDKDNYDAISVGNIFNISSQIHLSKTAVSDVYYKPVNEMIDP